MNFFLAFGANFISSWIRIRIRNADPDPGDKSNADTCGSGSETLLRTTVVEPNRKELILLVGAGAVTNFRLRNAGYQCTGSRYARIRNYLHVRIGLRIRN
jgi:hypothetical protein